MKKMDLGWSGRRELWDCWGQPWRKTWEGHTRPCVTWPRPPASPLVTSLLVSPLPLPGHLPSWASVTWSSSLLWTLGTGWVFCLRLFPSSFARMSSPLRRYFLLVASQRHRLKEFSSNSFVTSPRLPFLMAFMVSETVLFIYGHGCLSSISSGSPSGMYAPQHGISVCVVPCCTFLAPRAWLESEQAKNTCRSEGRRETRRQVGRDTQNASM